MGTKSRVNLNTNIDLKQIPTSKIVNEISHCAR